MFVKAFFNSKTHTGVATEDYLLLVGGMRLCLTPPPTNNR